LADWASASEGAKAEIPATKLRRVMMFDIAAPGLEIHFEFNSVYGAARRKESYQSCCSEGTKLALFALV
jgi:hypothetical protein